MTPAPERNNGSWFESFCSTRAGVVAACAFVIALDLFLFRRALGLYFIQDDFHYLWFTSDQTPGGFVKLFTTQNVFYRPVSNHLYFFVLQWLFGTNPLPYHVGNLLVHIINSLAVGYLVYLLTNSRALALASSIIFTSRVGHIISIYWICVTTQSMPLMFFLLCLIFYIHYHKSGRVSLLLGSYAFFALSVFSNINAPVFIVLIVAYDVLLEDTRSFLAIMKRESGFYAVFAAFLILQFVVFGYEPPGEFYRTGTGAVVLQNFGTLNLYGFNLLYLIDYFTVYPSYMVIAGFVAGVLVMAASALGFFDSRGRGAPRDARLYVFFACWYVVGVVPYLPLADHVRLAERVWPQYITVPAVALAFVSAHLIARFLKTRGLIAGLLLIVVVSFISVRTFEKEEVETKGTIYKSQVARNVIADLKAGIERQPGAERILILGGQVELFWILEYGKYAEVFLGGSRPIYYLNSSESLRPDPASLALRYEDMHLHKIY